MRFIFKLGFVLLLLPLLAACGQSSDNPLVGESAPDFTLPDASGDTVALADYSGQPVLLYFHMAVG